MPWFCRNLIQTASISVTTGLGLTFAHFAKRAIGNVMPASAIANANETFKPSMYATRIPGNSDAENTLLSCVAPVLTTKDGLIPGTVMGTRSRRRLANAV